MKPDDDDADADDDDGVDDDDEYDDNNDDDDEDDGAAADDDEEEDDDGDDNEYDDNDDDEDVAAAAADDDDDDGDDDDGDDDDDDDDDETSLKYFLNSLHQEVSEGKPDARDWFISVDEAYKALKQMTNNELPGSDCLSKEYYTNFLEKTWKILSTLVTLSIVCQSHRDNMYLKLSALKCV